MNNKVKFASSGRTKVPDTAKPLSKDEILLQRELNKMKEERDDITLKARDIELHIESAEYQ